MRYFEVRLVLEALDDADAHKLAFRLGQRPPHTHDYTLTGEIQ